MANSTNYMLAKLHTHKSTVDLPARSEPQNEANEINEIQDDLAPVLAPNESLENILKSCLSTKREKKLTPGS